MLGIGLQASDFAREPFILHFLQTLGQHRVIQVGGDHAAVRSHFRFQQQREVGRAGADIEGGSPLDGRDERRGPFFPAMMESEAQERVVEVVHAGDGREHPLDGLLARRAGPSRNRARGTRRLALLLHGFLH